MFSALKKLAKVGDDRNQDAPSPMSSSLQKKFSKGVHYNMKILIKGDRNVGKSCLLQRLQGGPFVEEYRPTDQIQAAAIHWAYKATDHIVKVEVWEVVDKGRAKKKAPLGLKLENQAAGDEQDTETPMLDATFLDVYKDANGVILMMDITKPWTFEYVQKELSLIPADLPVVVLGNHCDMHHHRQVHPHHLEQVMEMAKEKRTAPVRYAEASMRNGFGLRFLHKFLSVPFLRLQRTSLLQQLNRNQKDTQQAEIELDDFQSSEECDYSLFVERIAAKRRENNASVAPRGRSIVLGAGKPIVPPHVNPLAATSLNPIPSTSSQPATPYSGAEQKSYISPVMIASPTTVKEEKPRTFLSNPLSSGDSGNTPDPLEEFYAGTLERSFLEEGSPPVGVMTYTKTHSLDDSDDENSANPMVLTVEDDIDDIPETTNKKYQSQTTARSDRVPRDDGPIFERSSDVYAPQSDISQGSLPERGHFNNSSGISSKESMNQSSVSSKDIYIHSSTKCLQSGLLVQDGFLSQSDPNMEFKRRSGTSEEDFAGIDRLSIYEKGQRSSDEGNMTSLPRVWPNDVSVRRSPEGVEDPESNKEKEYKKHKEERKHKKSKKSKDKDHEKEKTDKSHRSSVEKAERRERKRREKAALHALYADNDQYDAL